MDNFKQALFKAPFSFNGRIRRTEYGISYAIYIFSIYGLSALIGSEDNLSFLTILFIPILWFYFAQGAKRCHDRGNSGLYQIIPFYLLWMLFADSDFGQNEYGLNPKGIGNLNEIDEIAEQLVD